MARLESRMMRTTWETYSANMLWNLAQMLSGWKMQIKSYSDIIDRKKKESRKPQTQETATEIRDRFMNMFQGGERE